MSEGEDRLVVAVALIAIVVFASFIALTAPQIQPYAATTFPSTILDDYGRNVTLVKQPEKIVSLAPSNTEILFALGLGSKVVGVTRYCDHPPEVKDMVKRGEITVIGGFADPSIERIVALNPNLVLAATTLQKRTVTLLEDKGLKVVALNPRNIKEILNDIFLVGKVTGHIKEANKLVKNMDQRIDKVISKTRDVGYRPSVYYEVWHQPLMSAGPGTWIHELIESAGGTNIFADAKGEYPIISSESVVKRNPQIIIIKIGYMGGVGKEEIRKRPSWEAVDAVKNNRIYEIDENILIRPGPRIVEGLEALTKVIHPELL